MHNILSGDTSRPLLAAVTQTQASVGKEVITMAKKIGRDARTGRFIPVKVAQNRKATAVVETIKTPKK